MLNYIRDIMTFDIHAPPRKKSKIFLQSLLPIFFDVFKIFLDLHKFSQPLRQAMKILQRQVKNKLSA